MRTDAALDTRRPISHWTGWGQWIALVTMTLDHLSRHVLPAEAGVEWMQTTVGRIAFPLFAAMVAWHGLFNTSNPMRYARRVLIIGLAAQIPFMLMPRNYDGLLLNVCFTLALGLMWGAWMRDRLARHRDGDLGTPMLALLLGASFGLMLLASQWVEYGLNGLMLIPLLMLAMYHLNEAGSGTGDDHARRLLAALSAVPVLLVAWQMNHSEVAKLFTAGTCAAVLLLAAGASRRVPQVVLAMPRQLWLAWYPGHFALIALFLWATGVIG